MPNGVVPSLCRYTHNTKDNADCTHCQERVAATGTVYSKHIVVTHLRLVYSRACPQQRPHHLDTAMLAGSKQRGGAMILRRHKHKKRHTTTPHLPTRPQKNALSSLHDESQQKQKHDQRQRLSGVSPPVIAMGDHPLGHVHLPGLQPRLPQPAPSPPQCGHAG
jgi:hypothetical protein